MIELRISRPPSANRLWRYSEGRVHKSAEYRTWLATVQWEIFSQIKKQTIEGPFKMTLAAQRPDRRRRDIDNLIKPTLDALAHAKVIEDDRACEWVEAYWAGRGEKCYVTLEPVELDDEDQS